MRADRVRMRRREPAKQEKGAPVMTVARESFVVQVWVKS